VTLNRILADAGYRGHNAPPDYRFKVYTAGQKRRMTEHIRRQLRQRSAVEPVIGHLKDDHRMDRNYLAYRLGDANNAVLAAVGYNFRRLLAWLRLLLRVVPYILALSDQPIYRTSPGFFTFDAFSRRWHSKVRDSIWKYE
jgi:transposase, IS5 family